MAEKGKRRIKPAGQITQSQLVTTFGPGAMVDLPDVSILIGGLDLWRGDKRYIGEERLASRVAETLGVSRVDLYAPPVDSDDPGAPATGVSGVLFPLWFVARTSGTLEFGGRVYNTRPVVAYSQLERGQYLGDDRKRHGVTPMRFVQACVNGHIGDIDWRRFVHAPGVRCHGQLWLDEGASMSDLRNVFVRCGTCWARKPISSAAAPGALGSCRGTRPWLGQFADEPCMDATGDPLKNRLLIRSASNSYFSQVLSVISIPDPDQEVRDAVDQVYDDFLQYVESAADVQRERKKAKVAAALGQLDSNKVWAELSRRFSGTSTERKRIKELEFESLSQAPVELGSLAPQGEFYARALPESSIPEAYRGLIDRVVLVHKLREVVAQVGFTRFESAMPDIDGELAIGVKRAALALEPAWVPAFENRGEGVFIGFSESAVTSWLARDSVKKREEELRKAYQSWLRRRGIPEGVFRGAPYVMLHSLSHLLITAVALECGYSATATCERIYAGDYGYGILLYTGSAGSEGTLGGLVQEGKQLGLHLDRALAMGRLCSNDPVCAQHIPDNQEEERFLHGAACHGCVLVAETSCEVRNDYLDRALVVKTVEGGAFAFFEDGGEL